MAALMQSVGASSPPGWWNPTGSSPLMPQKDFSGLDSYPPDGFVSYLKNSLSPAISLQTSLSVVNKMTEIGKNMFRLFQCL